jgi:hypothetical protein
VPLFDSSHWYNWAKTNCIPFKGETISVVAWRFPLLFLECVVVAILMRFESYKADEIRRCSVRAEREHFVKPSPARCRVLPALRGILILLLFGRSPGLSNVITKREAFGVIRLLYFLLLSVMPIRLYTPCIDKYTSGAFITVRLFDLYLRSTNVSLTWLRVFVAFLDECRFT